MPLNDCHDSVSELLANLESGARTATLYAFWLGVVIGLLCGVGAMMLTT